MKRVFIIVILLSIFGITIAQNEISNARVQVLDTIVIVTYDLDIKADIEIFISLKNDGSFIGPLKEVTGAVGNAILPEKNKMLMWNVLKEIGYVDYPNAVIKVAAYPNNVINNVPNVPEPPKPPKQDERLYAEGRFVNVSYQDKTLLTQMVRNRMADTPSALQQYNRGIKQYKSGKKMSIAGVPLFIIGAGCTAASVYAFLLEEYPLYPVYISGSVFVIGTTLLIFSGPIMKKKGNRNVSRAVDAYNLSNSLSQIDLKLGITGNGLGLQLNF